ncbi:MAG: hypothetical protein JKY51_01850, partial [Opitutaceae bacterium]|nr:hypothetical protein [Opitutaceae bacterium]
MDTAKKHAKMFAFTKQKNIMNPLLEELELPCFSKLKATDIEPAMDALLEENREKINALLDGDGAYSWQSLIYPLEEIDDRLSRVWSPISHLNSVLNNEEWRDAYSNCLPKLSEYSTEMGQN